MGSSLLDIPLCARLRKYRIHSRCAEGYQQGRFLHPLRLNAELVGEVEEIFRHEVERSRWWNRRSFPWSVFERAIDERSVQSVLVRGLQVVLVGGGQHDLFGVLG